jgi:hypothetical protein
MKVYIDESLTTNNTHNSRMGDPVHLKGIHLILRKKKGTKIERQRERLSPSPKKTKT